MQMIDIAGSPPQVRGKRYGTRTLSNAGGITPAGAGKTRIGGGVCPNAEDHPRRCGENIRSLKASGKRKGSPPQVRGKQETKIREARVQRITPAGAGKTAEVDANERAFRDHPRRCGENLQQRL